MTATLHVHRFGPAAAPPILAVHGLTGHGLRWRSLAERLPELAVIAPDLIGHGHSSWDAPWTIDANVAALAAVLRNEGAPMPVVGHSFGGAIALHLAAAHPDLVSSLVLLDPAVAIGGGRARRIAEEMLRSPDYPDRAEARAEKADGGWSDVAPELLDTELDEHLISLGDGRWGWRISIPAMMSYWSELARDVVVPPSDTPTTVVRATRTDPPYVGEGLLAALRERLGAQLRVVDLDCGHMVAQARPDETAAVIRGRIRAA